MVDPFTRSGGGLVVDHACAEDNGRGGSLHDPGRSARAELVAQARLGGLFG